MREFELLRMLSRSRGELVNGAFDLARTQERRAELEKAEQMCELMEKELRFMTVDDGEQYTVPSLELLEHNLEAAMHKVRSEKDRKIGGEITYLENMVRRTPTTHGLAGNLKILFLLRLHLSLHFLFPKLVSLYLLAIHSCDG